MIIGTFIKAISTKSMEPSLVNPYPLVKDSYYVASMGKEQLSTNHKMLVRHS